MRFLYIVFIFLTLAMPALADLKGDFIYAVSFGRVEDVKLLLNKGADPNEKDHQGWPMLSVAAARADEQAVPIVRTLVDAGADVNATDEKGITPLVVAVQHNNAPIVDYLIAHKADYHIEIKDGGTLLQIAERTNNPKIIDIIGSLVKAEEDLHTYRHSEENRQRLIKEYFYYNCTQSYLKYNLDRRLYLKEDGKKAAEALLALHKQKEQTSLEDLYRYFRIRPVHIVSSAYKVRNSIAKQLNDMVSNRNRRAKGVGTEKDMVERCETMAKKFQAQMIQMQQKKK